MLDNVLTYTIQLGYQKIEYDIFWKNVIRRGGASTACGRKSEKMYLVEKINYEL
jgi:hypothetical protein